MKHFKSWRSYIDFASRTQFKRRFIHDADVMEFLDTLLETCIHREREIKKGAVLWRAQAGCERDMNYLEGKHFGEERPYPNKRMKPLPYQASEGRVNSKGIPCLYLSTKRKTALAEVRPWIGALVTLAKMTILKNLKVVDCSFNALQKVPYELGEPNPMLRDKMVWSHIDRAYSKPIQHNDHVADNVPTQVIAEFLKAKKFDGIIYQSNLDNGKNVALFDIDAAAVHSCVVYEATKLRYDFKMASNPPRIRRVIL